MHLMFTIDASGKRAYTLNKTAEGRVTRSAHPARFSPDDKWSRYRRIMRKRYAVLLARHLESGKLPAPGAGGADASMDA